MLGLLRSLLIALGVVCSLTGAVSGELYPARTRTVRGPSHRNTRLPVRDADHTLEWDAARLEWLEVSSPNTDEDPAPAEAASFAEERPAFSCWHALTPEALTPPAAGMFPHSGRAPPTLL
ncbi:MAG: hypothetical protein SFV51_18095 [Bryobacteraceae bacterium]|nr:hypothetical protein [Bryobacteraceae bacterium]